VEGAAPILAVKVLSGVARLDGRFGMAMAAKVLTGSEDKMLRQFGLHRLSTYGLLSEYTQSQVQDWIKELISKGCIGSRRVSMGEKIYPVISLTDRGQNVMRGTAEIRLSPVLKLIRTSTVDQHPLRDSEKEIFERLRDVRTRIAKEEKLPSYCIFHDRTLREMARERPATPAELLGIMGVGQVTLRKYGSAFLEVLQQIRNEGQYHSNT
jgi:ATP-dependent DNA helicase RecQ